MVKEQFNEAILDELVTSVKSEEDLSVIMRELSKRLMQKALDAEMTEHLGHESGQEVANTEGNTRNGSSQKTVKGELGEITLDIPRDRQGSFEPQLVKKHQRRLMGIDDRIISLYGRGLSTTDIEAELRECYGVNVSPSLISEVTKAVLEDLRLWQNRALDVLYPVVYLDCINAKLRVDGIVRNQAVYVAIGINLDGQKDALGLWVGKEAHEGASFWLSVLNDLKHRGLEDVFIFCVDGLKGFPEAIEQVYPDSEVQLCIVHLVRNSLQFVPWKDRKQVAADLRKIYTAPNEDKAKEALDNFKDTYQNRYPSIHQIWERNWQNIIPIFHYPPDIRKAIYTTNIIESLNYSLKRKVKLRGSFPTEDSLLKVLFLAIDSASQKWTMPIRNWKQALNWFAQLFGDRLLNRLRTQN